MTGRDGGDRDRGRGATGGREGREALARLTTPPGRCATCRHLRVVASRRSVFVRCGLSDADPRFPRYPALPVVSCAGYAAESDSPAG